MSGYLQRMVSNARVPGRAIHPIVGSLYSAPDAGLPVESWEAEESSIVIRPSDSVQSMEAQPSVSRDLTSMYRPRRESEWKPLLRERAPESRSEPVQPAPAIGAEESRASRTGPPMAVSGIEPDRPRATGSPYRPLIEVRPEAEGRREAPVTPPMFASAPRVQGYPRRTAPAEAASHDEIEIHIGRIEVTAVAQAAVRPAPQPARKALNLEEYLKRPRGGHR